MMWETVTAEVQAKGSEVRLGAEVEKILWKHNQVEAVEVAINGKQERIDATHFVSSMPIRELIQKLEPAAPDQIQKAAGRWDTL